MLPQIVGKYYTYIYIHIVLGESSGTPFAFGSPLSEIRLSELIRLPLSHSPLMTIIYESTCHAFVVNYHFKHNGELDLIYGLRWHHDSPIWPWKCLFVASFPLLHTWRVRAATFALECNQYQRNQQVLLIVVCACVCVCVSWIVTVTVATVQCLPVGCVCVLIERTQRTRLMTIHEGLCLRYKQK